ncbi:MAG: hypothetical protein C4K49_04985 [Candidatus Thorarchaeota archaeon]|nr:MAG: hypothetical protein C4K49_04985 [Candidatus Thorarchaeota archaeon]
MFELGASYYSGCAIPFEQFLSFSRDLGIKYVEVQMEHPFIPSEIGPGDLMDIEALFSSFRISPLIHGPIHDSNLSSLKESMRRASVEFVFECVDFARTIGAPHVVIHAGTCPSDQIHSMFDHALASFKMSLSSIAAYASERGIRIGIENGPASKNRSTVLVPQDHLKFVKEFEDLGVAAVLDIGHAHTAGLDLAVYATTLDKSLIELHVHDNSGDSDDHLRLGDGNVPFKPFLKTVGSLGFVGPVVLELHTKEHLADGVAFLRAQEKLVTEPSLVVQ